MASDEGRLRGARLTPYHATMTGIITVSIACASDTEAGTIACALVEQRLAACVQAHPVKSTYRWQGAIETSDEVMLTVKTLSAKLPELAEAVRGLHSYEVPEIIAQPVAWADETYAEWLRESLA